MIRTGIYRVDEPAWLEARLDYLTGSNTAVALDVSKYRTRGLLLLEQSGRAASAFVGNEQTELGNDLEEVIARIAVRRYGWDLVLCGELLVDSQCTDLGCTPDYLMDTPWGLAVVQVKATTSKAQEDVNPVLKDGSPSTAAYAFGPPLDYQLQVQTEMAVTGARLGCLLVGHFGPPGFKVRAYPILRSEIAIARIRAEARVFMRDVRTIREGKVA